MHFKITFSETITFKPSNRLEEWLEDDEDISQNLDFEQKSFYNNDRTSIPSSEKKEDDPWI